LHLHTKKGHGYQPAENNPTAFHAPGKFDPETGEQLTKNADGEPPRYQDVFGETLLEMAKKNPRIVGVTPAMPSGCSMNIMMKEMPDRCFDVGIAEGHAVTFSAGMAKDGLIPVCNIYSSFAQRSYDNVIHDVAINKLHVVMCLDRAGIVGEDGPTHHGVFDMPSLRTIPNLTIASPMNEAELRRLMYTAIECQNGPFVIRYPRGNGVMVDWQCPLEALPIGKGRLVSEEKNYTPTNKHMAILSMGPLGNTVQNAINAITQEQDNAYLPAHYDMRFLKPLDEEIMKMVAEKYDHIITIEDGSLNGGFGSAILEWLADNGFSKKVTRLGIPDKFIEHGAPAQLYKLVGLDVESIIKIIRQD
jgi:1-deoxy-D-xylulose-5-phosphate synthase